MASCEYAQVKHNCMCDDVMMFLATLLFLVEITFDWAESNVSQSRCTTPHNTAATLFWVIFEINENRFPIVPAVSKGIKSEYKEELAKVVSTFTSLLSLSSPRPFGSFPCQL